MYVGVAEGQVLIKVETNLRRRLSESSGSVIKMKCTLCTLSVHGGCVRVLGMGVNRKCTQRTLHLYDAAAAF